MEPRYTLKQLPLPAKLVLSVFLLAVGLGYFSAMVQLHLQHSSRNGEPLPSPSDVVEIFAGVKKYDPATTLTPVSKLEKLIMGPIEGAAWNGSGSMAAAFFHKSDSEYKSLFKNEATKQQLMAEREGERQALKHWMNLEDDERKKVYDADAMNRPGSVAKITDAYFEKGIIKVKSIMDDRCVRCHGKDQPQDKFPLENYEQITKYLDAPKTANLVPGSWIPSGRQVSIDKLTQSTHAHLLSFAMLFGLTGFIFAFTSYPKIVRLIVAPMVLIAQVCDVSCWWLARIDGVGPTFALAIMGTGTVVGLGLVVHIFGSLFNMYGRKGRLVLIGMLIIATGGFSVLYTKAIEPALKAQKEAVPAAK
ncbi:hypothetical protein BH11PLA2_BH11PLA2_47860 [soil metagenome]